MRDFPTNPLKIVYPDSPPIIPIGQKVLKRRKELDLSRGQLAQLINASEHSLSSWEKGKTKPRASSIHLLTEWLKQTDFYGPDKHFARSVLLERIAVKRRKLDLSQKQLSQFLGVREQTLNKWEIGAVFPSNAKLRQLIRLLFDGAFERVAEHAKFVKLGQDIKKRRKRFGLTQPELAKHFSVSTKTLVTWERGSKPSAAKLSEIATWLGEEIPRQAKRIRKKRHIGKDIKKKRLALGSSTNEVSRQLSVDPTTVRDWESGMPVPRHANAIKVMEWLAEPMPARSRLAKVKDAVRRMKKKRLSLGWSQTRLVKQLNVGKNRVCEWEKGRSQPGPGSLKKIEE